MFIIALDADSRPTCHSRYDYRRQSNRVQENVNKWNDQMEMLVEGYLHWTAHGTPKETAGNSWTLRIVSFESMIYIILPLAHRPFLGRIWKQGVQQYQGL
jgi:hypothetical protein